MKFRFNNFIISLIIGTITEIIIFTWFYDHYTVENMAPMIQGLKDAESIVMVWDWLNPARIDAFYQLFLFWAVVPFVTMLVALPGWTKAAAIVLWIPYFYIDLISTGVIFMTAGQLELHNEIFTNFFFGIDPTIEEKVTVFLLRMPFSVVVVSTLACLINKRS